MRFIKIGLVLIFNLLFSSTGVTQNLVPNPSFEDYNLCPSGISQVNRCVDWRNFGKTPDYLNSCNTGGLNVPNTIFGYQPDHTGQAHCGIVLYSKPTLPAGPNNREFIGVPLTQNLTIGIKYYFSFYINYSWTPGSAMACNNAGLRFSTVDFDSCCPPPVNNWSHFHSDSILSDSVNWVKLSGSIVADSSYAYLIIGNFYDDSNTDTIHLSSSINSAYYYIDDVCVSIDSLFNQNWTGNYELNYQSKINIYPNPASDHITIESLLYFHGFEILNYLGQKVMQDYNLHDRINSIDLSKLNKGLYFLLLKNNESSYLLKIIKH